MKNLQIKQALLSVALMTASSFVNTALAHDINNSLTAATAADVFSVSCATGTTNVFFQIDNAVTDGRAFKATLAQQNLPSNTMNTQSPDNGTSPSKTLLGPMGLYTLTVTQTAGGTTAANYHVLLHCQNGTIHVGTTITTVTNAP